MTNFINQIGMTGNFPLSVTQGGTGVATLTTAYGVLCAGTTATGVVQTLSALGASGTVLTSNGAGALPSFQTVSVPVGSILQVVQGTLTTTASSASSTMADTGLTVSITPASSSNKILVMAFICTSADVGVNNSAFLNLVRGSTNILQGSAASTRTQVTANSAPPTTGETAASTMIYLDSPATTSATTYKVQFAASNNTGTVYINRSVTDTDAATQGRPASSIIVMEVKG